MPLALGFTLGWSLALNYAIAGTWGVFDSSGGWQAADLALSALSLCALLSVLFRWAAESAIGWIPVTSGSLRRQCLLATLVATAGALLPFFIWLLVHDNALISTVSDPAVNPRVRGWPLAGWTAFSYPPIASLGSAPGCVVLIALPCAYAVAGAARRASPARIGRALLSGLIAAIAGPGVALGYVVALRAAVHGAPTRYPDGLGYVVTITTWILLVGCVAAAIMTARGDGEMRLSTGLLTVLVGTAIGSPLATAAVFVGACGEQALSCAARGSNWGVLYGNIGTTAPLEGAAVVAFLLIWGWPTALLARGKRAAAVATPAGPASRIGGAAIVAATYLGLAAGTYCCARYLLKI